MALLILLKNKTETSRAEVSRSIPIAVCKQKYNESHKQLLKSKLLLQFVDHKLKKCSRDMNSEISSLPSHNYNSCSSVYHTGRNFSLEFYFAILLMTNSLNFNSANHVIFKNLSMMAYTTKFKKSLIFNSMNLTILGHSAKLNYVYIFIL